MRSQLEKARDFQSRHKQGGAFIIPNPWDIGTARLLALAGFEALATTSAGYAFSRGQPDNTVGRDQMMVHLAEIAAATDLPTSADLENGFGDAPEAVAATIRLAAGCGVVGGSIEDGTGRSDNPIYSKELAIERVQAAAEAARSLPFPFTLTARAENFLVGLPDLKVTILRLQAYQEAGADVLFAPGLRTLEDIAAVISAVDKPLNVIMGLQGVRLTVAELSAIGVKRISVGSSLTRIAFGAFLRGSRELREHGTFGYAEEAKSSRELNEIFRSMR